MSNKYIFELDVIVDEVEFMQTLEPFDELANKFEACWGAKISKGTLCH